MKLTKWLMKQTAITRMGIYYIATALTYLTARAISIGFGWNTTWF